MTTACPICTSDTVSLWKTDEADYRRCPKCDYLKPCATGLKPLELNVQIYTEKFDERLSTVSVVDPKRARKYGRLLAAVASRRSTGNFLDIGCGAGRLLQVAAARQWQAFGADPAMTNAARQKRDGITIVPRVLQECGFEDGFFDVVHANEVAEHVPDVSDLVGEIARILRPGGVVVFRTPHYRSWSARLVGSRWRQYGLWGKGHVGFLSVKTFRYLFSQHSLRLNRVETQHFSVRDWWGEKRSPLRRIVHRVCRLVEPIVRLTHNGERLTVWGEKPSA